MSEITTTERLKQLLPELFVEKKLQGQYYLRLQLTAKITVLIDLKYVRESLIVPADLITAIPNLPNYVLGIMSSRSQVFLTLDLAHAIGLPPETFDFRQYTTVVIKTNLRTLNADFEGELDFFDESQLLGFTVAKIRGISRIQADAFEPVMGEIPDSLAPVVKSSLVYEEDRAYLLDIPKLLQIKLPTI